MFGLGVLLVLVAAGWAFWLSWFAVPPHTGVQGYCEDIVYKPGFELDRTRPAADCEIAIERLNGTHLTYVRTDATGRFQVDLRPGMYQVYFVHSVSRKWSQVIAEGILDVHPGGYTPVKLEREVTSVSVD
ncbi:hypothetical protein FRUB_07118 [Fimbriiglobus ruber]|uniref:Carboxypeptidase regulatory-like domain-containing protein n=1 Tax=Fimbriiglobus ruber TaxID=1908690 RepID=A0A225DHG1_9BACT|nr:hypothetical protein FRUB_07118 [Fimbriiglobus ruber]